MALAAAFLVIVACSCYRMRLCHGAAAAAASVVVCVVSHSLSAHTLHSPRSRCCADTSIYLFRITVTSPCAYIKPILFSLVSSSGTTDPPSCSLIAASLSCFPSLRVLSSPLRLLLLPQLFFSPPILLRQLPPLAFVSPPTATPARSRHTSSQAPGTHTRASSALTQLARPVGYVTHRRQLCSRALHRTQRSCPWPWKPTRNPWKPWQLGRTSRTDRIRSAACAALALALARTTLLCFETRCIRVLAHPPHDARSDSLSIWGHPQQRASQGQT